MSQRDVIWNSVKFIGTISVIAATVIPASAQQRPTSPVAAAPVENRYPDGSKLQSQYSSAQRSVVLPSAAPRGGENRVALARPQRVQTDWRKGSPWWQRQTSQVGGMDQRVAGTRVRQMAADGAGGRTEKSTRGSRWQNGGGLCSRGRDYPPKGKGKGRTQRSGRAGRPVKVDATQVTVGAAEPVEGGGRECSVGPAGPEPELQM